MATSIHLAFSQHYPLTITPDIIWMVISQGFANHINNNAEALRNKFVSHQNKVELTVEALRLDRLQDWSFAVAQWSLLIREYIDPRLYQLMLCDFSTTTEIIHAASQIVMMNALQQYFDYRLVTICGIPRINLLGTIDDWQVIRDRVTAIAEYDLEWWTRRLLPICDALIETAKGNPALEFWQHIYKPQRVYGGDVITGWLADLFPYLRHEITKTPSIRNSILSIPRSEITVNNGIRLESLPIGLAETSFSLKAIRETRTLELIGGFIGVTQDSDGTLQPEIGWGVREQDVFTQLISKLGIKQQGISATDWSEMPFLTANIPKELIQLTTKLAGVTIYSETKHYWYLKTPAEYRPCKISTSNQYFTNFIDLTGDRCLAYGFVKRTIGEWYQEHYQTWQEVWIVVGKAVNVQPETEIVLVQDKLVLEEAKIIAKGISQLLSRIIAAEGKYYFDDPDFVPDDDLMNLSK